VTNEQAYQHAVAQPGWEGEGTQARVLFDTNREPPYYVCSLKAGQVWIAGDGNTWEEAFANARPLGSG
jgi:hypothetical protein